MCCASTTPTACSSPRRSACRWRCSCLTAYCSPRRAEAGMFLRQAWQQRANSKVEEDHMLLPSVVIGLRCLPALWRWVSHRSHSVRMTALQKPTQRYFSLQRTFLNAAHERRRTNRTRILTVRRSWFNSLRPVSTTVEYLKVCRMQTKYFELIVHIRLCLSK